MPTMDSWNLITKYYHIKNYFTWIKPVPHIHLWMYRFKFHWKLLTSVLLFFFVFLLYANKRLLFFYWEIVQNDYSLWVLSDNLIAIFKDVDCGVVNGVELAEK